MPLIRTASSLLQLPPTRWPEVNSLCKRICFHCNTCLSVLVKAGAGVAFQPGDLWEDGLLLRDIAIPRVGDDISLLTHSNLRHNAGIQACMSFLREALLSDPLEQRLIALSPGDR